MIARLEGSIIEKHFPDVLLDVQGVGYEVQVSMNTFYQLPEAGSKAVLLTHFSVREDAQQLFGFIDVKERELFRSLIKVNGIGPKSALTILSSTTVEHFIACVIHQDSASLVKLPGIGKKTAERLLIEMRDKLQAEHPHGLTHLPAGAVQNLPNTPKQEAISALLSLGYNTNEAQKALAQANEQDSSEKLIRYALRELAK